MKQHMPRRRGNGDCIGDGQVGLRVKLRPHRLTVRQMETVVYVLLNSGEVDAR